MSEHYLGPLSTSDEITSELRRRKSKDQHKTVSAANKKLIAEKVEIEKKDGWRIVRKNAKSTRMAKPKPVDEQLEDEVWSILAQMGFKEMSKGRNFTIAVEDGLDPRQIDVFAKDDETVIIVECTQRETPGKKNMANLIEKIRAIREPAFKSIRKFYGQQAKLKVKHIIATRNVAWSEADLNKCKEAQITVITDGEIDYYASLVQHLKQAARYQFLAHIFGGQKIDGLTRRVLATRGKMGGDPFYTFLIPPDELLKIAYVGHKASRDTENLETYQRLLQPNRLKKIAKFINDGGKFPTNIVINLKTGKKSGLKFEEIEKFDNETLGKLHLPPNYASAWVIDGQHRLYGYAYARNMEGFNQDTSMIPVLAYENLPADKEMNLFIDINSKQVKVSPGLLVELYADLHWKSTDAEKAFQALLSRIASRLNADKISPLNDRMVVTGKKKTQYRCLTQTSIRDGLGERGAKLLGTLSKGSVVPGPFSTGQADAYDENLKKGLTVLSDCLRMFADQLPSHWELGDGPGGYLCTNNGLRALFHIMKDVADHVRHKDGIELYGLDADATFNAVEPYLQVLVDFFKNASDQDIQVFRRIGSSLTAVRQQAWGMEAQIQKKHPTFNPAGLEEYLESRDEAGTEEARTKVLRIQRRLFDYVIETLKNHFGTHDRAWWVKGVPSKIRIDCSARWEAKDQEGEPESQLFLQNYVDICAHNWDLVKDVISLDEKDKMAKTKNTKWIRDLNDIRNKVAHPEQGVLDADQVAFVKDIYDKVEKHFPAESSQTQPAV
ncbi:DGQHR domain-containing protein [Marivibrio halodurans]|uniref:DGQHR domain-containing protein n=1 Tax=Marivibrio halodurans TaxID=2039722 RepID=A0A8J7SB79_9PROT|nr:DGQHR domain-containing protein [Marivibrio halodurans]MBP5858832.1 DGQHR domain-containing protein [Marivibrio halodurans]